MKKILIIYILLLLLSSSCRKLVQDKFPSFENAITANSILTDSEPMKIHLSLTDELNKFQLQNIENADLKVYNQDSLLIEFAYIDSGVYTSNYYPKQGDSIFFSLKTENDYIQSNCIIPNAVEITDFSVEEDAYVDNEGRLQPIVNFEIPNNKDYEEYFEAYIIIYNKKYGTILNEYQILYFDNTAEDKESISKSAKIEINYFSNPPEYYQYQLILKSVDYNYYQYVLCLGDYNLGRYPDFSNSSIVPTNLYSNIEDGYGIFCGYSQTISDKINPN